MLAMVNCTQLLLARSANTVHIVRPVLFCSPLICRRRLLLSSVSICNTSWHKVTHQGAARNGPVVLTPIRATPCCICRHVVSYYVMKCIICTQLLASIHLPSNSIYTILFFALLADDDVNNYTVI